MKNLVLYKGYKADLSEIFQSIQIRIAFLNDNFEQVHTPVVCRDFLGDVIYSKNTGKPVGIYGFSYNFKDRPCSSDHLYLSLKFPSIMGKEIFLSHLDYLHEKEKKAGTSPSVVEQTQYEDTLIIEGDSVWMTSMWKLSLWSFYLKVMSYKEVDSLDRPEREYQNSLSSSIEEKFLENITQDIPDDYNRTIMATHNFSGFNATICGNNPTLSQKIGL